MPAAFMKSSVPSRTGEYVGYSDRQFLLELGKGFLFETRQKRFTFDEENFYVDLVFYNRLLQCYVLIDLKIDKLTHQDLGQMEMYVNYYDRICPLSSGQERTPRETATVDSGI